MQMSGKTNLNEAASLTLVLSSHLVDWQMNLVDSNPEAKLALPKPPCWLNSLFLTDMHKEYHPPIFWKLIEEKKHSKINFHWGQKTFKQNASSDIWFLNYPFPQHQLIGNVRNYLFVITRYILLRYFHFSGYGKIVSINEPYTTRAIFLDSGPYCSASLPNNKSPSHSQIMTCLHRFFQTCLAGARRTRKGKRRAGIRNTYPIHQRPSIASDSGSACTAINLV